MCLVCLKAVHVIKCDEALVAFDNPRRIPWPSTWLMKTWLAPMPSHYVMRSSVYLRYLTKDLKNRKFLKFSILNQSLIYTLHNLYPLFILKRYCVVFEVLHSKQRYIISKFSLQLPRFNGALHHTLNLV